MNKLKRKKRRRNRAGSRQQKPSLPPKGRGFSMTDVLKWIPAIIKILETIFRHKP
jgi:hypothetical protein